jgi:hypothetical protein
MLDVPRHVVEFVAKLLAAHRRALGTPKGSRALGPFRQSVMAPRWFRERGCVHRLARDAGVSRPPVTAISMRPSTFSQLTPRSCTKF